MCYTVLLVGKREETEWLLDARVKHGRHCSCTACKQEDWTKITAPCGVHGSSCPAVYDPRPILHLARTTLVEHYYFDPAEIAESFNWDEIKDYYSGTFEDFVIETFEQHDGSQFHDKWFHNDASPQYGVELIARYDDE